MNILYSSNPRRSFYTQATYPEGSDSFDPWPRAVFDTEWLHIIDLGDKAFGRGIYYRVVPRRRYRGITFFVTGERTS